MTCILKAFAKRFDFDSVRISQIQTDCQFRSNGKCPVGWLYIIMYIYYSAWGVCVARIRQSGQCESLYTVERATSIGSTFFFMCVRKGPKTITSALGLGGMKEIWQ